MVDKIFGGPMSSAWPRSPDSQQRKRKSRADGEDENPTNDPHPKSLENPDKSPEVAGQESPAGVPTSVPLPDTKSRHIDEYV